MKSKTLLIAAASLAAGVMAASAAVYSQNIVGYVNFTLTNGLNCVANPLDLDGTGTNNTVYTCVGTYLPNVSKIIAFSGGNYTSSAFNKAAGTWNSAAGVTFALQPGKGFFIYIPPSATYPQTVTMVGQVLTGGLTNNLIAGIQLVGSQIPVAGGLDTNLGFQPASLDRYLPWNPNIQNYGTGQAYNGGSHVWTGGEPQIAVGQGFYLTAHATSVWTNSFNP